MRHAVQWSHTPEATKQHSTLSGSDLHINKIDGTTGTELTTPSEAIYDARWLKQTGGTITPSANSTTTLKVNKQDGTTEVFDVDTTNGRAGIGTTTPATPLDILATTPILQLPNGSAQGGSVQLGSSAHGVVRGATGTNNVS